MAGNMECFDDLPKRPSAHVTEEKAEAAFQKCLTDSGCFILQRSDRKDYGTDCEIEIVENGNATNIRIHVQLKGSERALNADGSLSVEINRTNLNYLLMHPHSFYAAYHVPTDTLFICFVETVLLKYERAGKNWTQQQSLTVNFIEALTTERLERLSESSSSTTRSARNRRIEQFKAGSENLVGLLRRTVPEVYVPDDLDSARQLLDHLYDQNADEEISASFERFMAVIGPDDDVIGCAYMSEINLGMFQRNQYPERIEAAVIYFNKQLCLGCYEQGSLYYTIGNAYSALGQEYDATEAYKAALLEPEFANSSDLASQGHKNLGTSFERLGDEASAIKHYREALRMNPLLPEAHYALAQFYIREGEWKSALEHLDQSVFTGPIYAKASSVAGWRANVLFIIGEGSAAFREINNVLAHPSHDTWVWPFFARLVASFGRATAKNARQALVFWNRYIGAHPDTSAGSREMLLTTLYLRAEGQDIGQSYTEFLDEFVRHIKHINNREEEAFLWDRLGHWAQDEGNWLEAERCFRVAYDIVGGDYGYCLGTALNFLGRFEDSLPILLEQAEYIQPDAMSWFQLGVAYGGLDQSGQAVKSYQKSLDLDPDYDLAMFNLGGIYWNIGSKVEAVSIWRMAVESFPHHELTAKLKCDLPQLFHLDSD